MSSASARVLLIQLRGLGVELVATNGRVSCSPATAVNADLRDRIARLEAPLLALLGGTTEPQILEMPQGGGAKTEIRSAPPPNFSSCSTPPARLREIAPVNPDLGGDRTYPCYCCGSREFWALARVRHWICGRCHAPDDPPREELIWLQLPPADSEPRPAALAKSAPEAGERVNVNSGEILTAPRAERTTAGQNPDPGTCTECGGRREVWGRVLRCTSCWLVASLTDERKVSVVEPPSNGTVPGEFFDSGAAEWD